MFPTNSKNKVGSQGNCVLNTTLVTLMPSSFINSHRKSVPRFNAVTSATVLAAWPTLGNRTTAPHRTFGSGTNFTVSSVITPSVPSAPR